MKLPWSYVKTNISYNVFEKFLKGKLGLEMFIAF